MKKVSGGLVAGVGCNNKNMEEEGIVAACVCVM